MATVNKTEILKIAASCIQLGELNAAEVILAELGKFEIEDILFNNLGEYNRSGVRLEMPKTFGDMHDFCDANELGGLCTVLISETFAVKFNKDDDDGMSEEEVDFANRLQNRMHEMIVSGKIEPQPHVFK